MNKVGRSRREYGEFQGFKLQSSSYPLSNGQLRVTLSVEKEPGVWILVAEHRTRVIEGVTTVFSGVVDIED